MHGSKSDILAIFQKGLGWPCPDSAALKNPSQDFKNSFCFGFLWVPSVLEGKIRVTPFFKGSIWCIPLLSVWHLSILSKNTDRCSYNLPFVTTDIWPHLGHQRFPEVLSYDWDDKKNTIFFHSSSAFPVPPLLQPQIKPANHSSFWWCNLRIPFHLPPFSPLN